MNSLNRFTRMIVFSAVVFAGAAFSAPGAAQAGHWSFSLGFAGPTHGHGCYGYGYCPPPVHVHRYYAVPACGYGYGGCYPAYPRPCPSCCW